MIECTLADGRTVELLQLRMRVADLDYMAGDPESIRANVLKRLPDFARMTAGRPINVLILPPPPGRLPPWVVVAELRCRKPKNPSADCSILALCWFAADLSQSPVDMLAGHLAGIAWDDHALETSEW